MTKILRILLIFLLSNLFITTVFAADDDEDSGVERKQIYHVYNDVDLIPTTQIKYSKPRITIKSIYPLLTSDEENLNVEKFNQLVQNIIDEEVADYKKRVADLASTRGNLPKSIRNGESTFDVDFDSSVVNTNSNPIISIRFSTQGYIVGMAHPYHHHRVLNYDLATGQQLELSDLFKPEAGYLGILADYANNVLMKRFKDSSMIGNGAAPALENYRNWNVNPAGLLITFDEYQVAPYVY